MQGPRLWLVRDWLLAVLKTFAGKLFLLLGVVSTATTFLPSSSRQWLSPTLLVGTLVAFAWASFSVYCAVWQEKQALEETIRATRVCVSFEDGWYDLRGPDAAHTEVAVHFRLQLTIANRDDRNTTVTFGDLGVPGQSGLALSGIKFFPEQKPVAHLVRAVDVAAGQTVRAILEVDVSFPNRDLSVWGKTVNVELHFRETFAGDLQPLAISVLHTP